MAQMSIEEAAMLGLLKAYVPTPFDPTHGVSVMLTEIRDNIVRVTAIPPEMFYEPGPWRR